MSREYLVYSVQFYKDARDRIGERFERLSCEWPAADTATEKRIVFYGAGEVAEIGYVCVQSTDLKLVGVVDSGPRRRFFGLDVQPAAALCGRTLGDMPFDRLVVMSFGERAEVEGELARIAYPTDDVSWI